MEIYGIGTCLGLRVVDATKIAVGMGMGGVPSARCVDGCPTGRNFDVAAINLQKLWHARGSGVDALGQFFELCQPMQIMARLPRLTNLEAGD